MISPKIRRKLLNHETLNEVLTGAGNAGHGGDCGKSEVDGRRADVHSAGQLREVDGWISVDSRLPDLREIYKDSPRESGMVLIFNGHYVSIGKYAETYKKRSLRWEDRFGRLAVVTHWQPLPAPPKDSK